MAQFIGALVSVTLRDGSTTRGRLQAINLELGTLTLGEDGKAMTIERANVAGLELLSAAAAVPAPSDPAILSIGRQTQPAPVASTSRPATLAPSAARTSGRRSASIALLTLLICAEKGHLQPDTRGSEADESAVPDDSVDEDDSPMPRGKKAPLRRQQTARPTQPAPTNGFSEDFDFARNLASFNKQKVRRPIELV